MGFEAPSLTECPFDKAQGSKEPSQPFGAIPSLCAFSQSVHGPRKKKNNSHTDTKALRGKNQRTLPDALAELSKKVTPAEAGVRQRCR